MKKPSVGWSTKALWGLCNLAGPVSAGDWRLSCGPKPTIDVFRGGGGLESHSSWLATAREADNLGRVEWPDSADTGWNPGGKQAWGRRVQSRTISEEDPLCEAGRPGPVQHRKAMVSHDTLSWIELDGWPQPADWVTRVDQSGSSSICPQYWPCLCCEIQHDSRRPSTAGWAQLRWRALSKYVLI